MTNYKANDRVILNFSDRRLAQRYNGEIATVTNRCYSTGGERYYITCDNSAMTELGISIIRAEDLKLISA